MIHASSDLSQSKIKMRKIMKKYRLKKIVLLGTAMS
ncbi:MAG: hypothetical protein ACI936_004157, partial [Paraglaciecola sp.]